MLGTNTIIATAFRENELKSMISNESEDTSGRTAAEIERVIYARVANFDFLERASGASRQEQWSVKIAKNEENAGSGSIRVRKVTNLREPGAAIQYVLTSKLDIGGKGSSAETSEQSTVDQFNVFKYLANKGMLKDRYTFPIEGSDLIWEVDCFPKPGEMYFEWVKIDLEKWPSGKELPQLPFAVAEMMDGDPGQQSEETKSKISRLYQDVFLIPNTKEPLTPVGQSESGQPGVAKESIADTGTDPGGETNGTQEGDEEAGAAAAAAEGGEGEEANKPKEGEDGGEQKPEGEEKPKAAGFADGVAEATTEAFSSAGQLLVPLIPILGPLVTVIHGQRGTDLGFMQTSQHTAETRSHISSDGRKTSKKELTGSYRLADMADAKDYIGLIERAVTDTARRARDIDRIDLALWPQKDGRFGVLDIKTDRNGETRVFTENNPGKLKWFSMSLAGKRVIKLNGTDVERFKFNGRTISCPFDGDVVEFDVGQIRHLKYQTKPKNNEFDIVEYNFDD